MYMCECVCAVVRFHVRTTLFLVSLHFDMHMYMCMYMCECKCVSVYVQL